MQINTSLYDSLPLCLHTRAMVSSAIGVAQPQLMPLARLISEYATDKIDTEASLAIMREKSECPDFLKLAIPTASQSSGSKKVQLPAGAVRIKESSERQLFHLAWNYLCRQSMASSRKKKSTEEQGGFEIRCHELLTRISGFDLVQRSASSPNRQSAEFVFEHLPWYEQLDLNDLYASPQNTIDFLLGKGFTLVERVSQVRPGNVVVYMHADLTGHFARVVTANKEEGIVAESKIGPGRYRHKIGLAHLAYGSYVIFLNETNLDNLPYLSPFIVKRIVRSAPPLRDMAELIAEYVTANDKVETGVMTRFFSAMVPTAIANLGFIDPQSAIPRGALRLENSPERQLTNLTLAFFSWVSAVQGQPISLETAVTNLFNTCQFISRISGVELIHHCGLKTSTQRPDRLVFGKFDWFKQLPASWMFGPPETVVSYLKTQGFSRVEKFSDIRPKNIVIYHSSTQVNHFGVVEEAGPEKGVTVVSKLGEKHIFKHPLSSVFYQLGNSVTVVSFP